MREKNVGRPKGKNKDQRLNVSISAKMKEEFRRITECNGTNISVKTCELISNYISMNKGVIK
jgi:hypothetical protein